MKWTYALKRARTTTRQKFLNLCSRPTMKRGLSKYGWFSRSSSSWTFLLKKHKLLSVTHYAWQNYPLHFVLFFMLTLNTFNFIWRIVNTENVHSDFWFLNTFSFQLVPFFLGSSLSHCLLSVHFCISLCWSARSKMIPFNRGLRVVVF